MSKLGKFLPAPGGYSRAEAEEIIRKAFPEERARAIVDLLRPAIRIWPIPNSGNPTISRFGGLPAVPSGWTWPFIDGNPLVFLAQIDCGDVHARCGKTALPEKGMLAFFGGYDDIMGCGPTDGGAVFHFADLGDLQLASHPEAEFEPQITCDISFYPHTEIPDPESRVVRALGLSKAERDDYYDLNESIARAGFPEDWYRDWISKLFGWADLVQQDFFRPSGNDDILLMQIGWYPDGENFEGWGPGGRAYFITNAKHLDARRFDAVELEVQTT